MKKLGTITKKSDGYQVVFDRTLQHSIEKVWNAITDPDQLKFWFTDIDMDFRVGGKINIRFRDKDKTLSEGKIIAIDPPHRFSWTWEDELAEWVLKSVDSHSTQLTLTYSKLSKAFAIKAPAGFHSLLDKLEERLAGSDSLHAFGTEEADPDQIKLKVQYADETFPLHPEAVETKPVVVEKLYKAPVARVWQALTDKDQMKQWYFDLDEFEPEVGFQFKFSGQGHKGERYLHLCAITEIIPNKKLQYSWQYEGYAGYSLVTFQLDQMGGKTKLTLTHHGLETFPNDMDDFAWKSFNEGWNHIAGISLPEFLEKQEFVSQ